MNYIKCRMQMEKNIFFFNISSEQKNINWLDEYSLE